MPKPRTSVSPENIADRWKKLWATPKRLDDATTDALFEEFQDQFVPSHMHRQFLKFFGTPKASFGNRFFVDDAVYKTWETRLSLLGVGETGHVEVTVIYGSPDALEGHALRGETRRSIKDIFMDDKHAACAIVRSPRITLYAFFEPKMKGCVVRSIRNPNWDANAISSETPSDEPLMIEHDAE